MKKTEPFKYVSWADTMKKSDITGTPKPKEDVKATLNDLPFAMARAEANKLMSYKYNSRTGTFMNENGDETKDAKAAVKYNRELDDVLGSQNQVSETKTKIQKKIFPNKKPQKRNYWEHFRKTGRILEPTKEEIARTKGPSTWEIIYDSMTPYEKGQWNLEKRKQGMDGRTGDPLPKEKPKKEEPYKYHIDLSVLEEESAKPVVQDNFMEDKLNNLLLDSAMRKIADANSGIGGISPRMLYAMNSGGPVDDGPPTLEEYLKLGITLANLTPSEQKVVQDLLNRTLFRTKDEK